MPRANIDLGWLAGLLTKTPTATTNPDFDPSQEVPYTDPVTGQTSGVMGQRPLIAPTNWQRLVHPEAAAAIDDINNKFTAQPAFSTQANLIRQSIAARNVANTPAWARLPNTTPEQEALLGGGTFQTPSQVMPEVRAAGDLQSNV